MLALGLSSAALPAQTFLAPDTILIQTFNIDPSDAMIDFPNGNDTVWVNWDADNLLTLCGSNQIIPGGWYWESDLGDLSDPPVNFAFTSCSFLEDPSQHNENWLISPPVYIPDSMAILHWRSMPFEGPGYMDGYKVLVSTSTNEPFTGAFTDTIFVAAEMLDYVKAGSLDPDDYIFSPGYVHANRYSDTAYFFLITPNAGAYTGRLEPHQVSLAQYAGKHIYIAFLHDSSDDSILQIDDISVIHGETSAASEPGIRSFALEAQPNPAGDWVLLSWNLPFGREGKLILSDLLGRTLQEQPVDNRTNGSIRLELRQLPQGIYPCTLRTSEGQQTILLVKQ